MRFRIHLLLSLLLLLCSALVSGQTPQFSESTLTLTGYAQDPADVYEVRDNSYVNYYKLIKPNPLGGFVLLGNSRTTIYYINGSGAMVWKQSLGSYQVESFEVSTTGAVHAVSISGASSKYTRFAAATGAVVGSEISYTSPNQIRGIAMDDANNVYIVGTNYNGGQTDIEVNKYTAGGTKLWATGKLLGLNTGTYNDEGAGIALSDNGQFVGLAGKSNGQLVVLLLDKDGNEKWQNYICDPGRSNMKNVRVRDNGDIYVCRDNSDFDSQTKAGLLSFLNANSGGWNPIRTPTNSSELIGDFDISSDGTIFFYHNNHYGITYGTLNFGGSETFLSGPNYSSSGTYAMSEIKSLPYFFVNRAKNELHLAARIEVNTESGTYTYSSAYKFDGFLSNQIFNVAKQSNTFTSAAGDSKGNIAVITNGATSFFYTPCANLAAPQITAQPVAKVSCTGVDVTFSLTATSSTPLLYQWKKGNVLLEDGSKYAGTTTNTLTVKSAQLTDAGSFSCQVVDNCKTVISSAVPLSFPDPPTITAQPQSTSQCLTTNAVFTVTTINGNNVKYQWKKGAAALADGTNIAGSNTNQLTMKAITIAEAADYTCEITSDCFTTPIITQKATLTVLTQSAAITTQPQPVSTCEGTQASFSVTATGANITYQWKKGSVNLADDTQISGSTSATLVIKDLQPESAGDYSCVVTGTCGTPVTSNTASLSIKPASKFSQQPASIEICEGGGATFSVTASGNSPTYTWRKGAAVIVDGGKYAGATSPTLIISSVTAAESGQYTCTISNACGNDVVSDAASLRISVPANVTSVSPDVQVCEGAFARMSIAVSDGAYTYQWKKDGNAIAESADVIGATSKELLISRAKTGDAGSYTLDVSSQCFSKQTTTAIKLSVVSTSITSQPTDLNKCEGEKAVFEIKSAGEFQSYQWSKDGVNLIDGNGLSGSQTKKLSIANVSTVIAGRYSCSMATACGTKLSSDRAELRVYAKPDLQIVLATCPGNSIPDWNVLVKDNNNTIGTYSIFLKGTTNVITDLRKLDGDGGVYIVTKTTAHCSDSVEWSNKCVLVGLEGETLPFIATSPNPSTGKFVVYHNGLEAGISMYDLTGRKMNAGIISRIGETAIDASGLSAGTYALIVEGNDGTRTVKRIVIQQ